jgi:hypothetical protein
MIDYFVQLLERAMVLFYWDFNKTEDLITLHELCQGVVPLTKSFGYGKL